MSVPRYTVWSRSGFPWPPSFVSSKYTEASHRLVASLMHQTPQNILLWSVAGCSAALTRMLAPTWMLCHFLKGSHPWKKTKTTNTEVLQTNAARLLLYLPYETAWNAAWQQTTWWVFSNPQLLKDCMCSSIDANTADDLGLWVLTRMNCSWRWRNALLPRVTVAPNAFCPSAAKHPQPQL